MKKFLPKTKNNTSGFTLIELMVTVSIIAILAVIGFTVLSNASKGARDARRKGDIDAIARALEVNYDETGGKYKVLAASQFTNGALPVDPQDANTNCLGGYCGYCATSTANAIPTVCAAANKVTTSLPAAGNAWTICANLETAVSGVNQYCKTNSR